MQTVQTKQSENTQTLTQSRQKNPSKTPPNKQQSTNIQQTIASDLSKTKPGTKFKEPANATKGTAVAKRYVPNTAPKKKNGYRPDTKSPAANQQSRDTKALVQKSFRSFFLRKAKDAGKSKKKEGSQENAVEKIQKEVQCPIYSRTTMLSLKRHIAWGYTGSAARHKCLFWLPHPHSPRGQVRRMDLFNFQKPSYF